MRIALLQMTSGIDPADNLATIRNAIAEARAGGAEMVFTPEMCGLLDRNRDRAAPRISRERDDVVLSAVAIAAREAGLWVHLGSLAVRDDRSDGKLSNRGFVIDPQGVVRARYDKQHLFDVDLPTGEVWRESASYVAGARTVVVPASEALLGMTICYDLRFPALFAALSQAGANLISVPAAFTVPTGAAHWHVLLRARAIENACWVVAAAQTGQHADGRATFGHSLVIDPWGTVVLDMGTAPGLGFADIDLAEVGRVRARIPVIAHRRDIPAAEVAS